MAAVEETTVAVLAVVDPPAADAREELDGDNLMPAKGKVAKETKAKKATLKRSAPTHPPYLEMITDAVVTLKEKTGSSQVAIQKFIEQKYKQLNPSFRKLLLFHLKKLVAEGKLVKVKASYKLPAQRKPAKKTAASKPKPAALTKAKPTAKSKGTANKKPVMKPKAKAAPKPAAKTKAVSKPKAKAAPAKRKAAPATKHKAAAVAKTKPAAKPKAKLVALPAKSARTSTRTSPGKKAAPKLAPTAKPMAKAKAKAKARPAPVKKAARVPVKKPSLRKANK